MDETRKLIPDVLRKYIEIRGNREHNKASERYVDVVFSYPGSAAGWAGSVPIHYRRTGLEANTPREIMACIRAAYDAMNPIHRVAWLVREKEFWEESNKEVTRQFFDKLSEFDWQCVECSLPRNPNWARRVQDIKEFGYTLATNTKMLCVKACKANKTHILLLALPRSAETGYETISPALRRRILKALDFRDAYEGRGGMPYALLPDHKFPEIRWDEHTKKVNEASVSDDELQKKFQLLTNQRNQQKREVCRSCYQTGTRGTPHGISFFTRDRKLGKVDSPGEGTLLRRVALVAAGTT